MTPKEEATKELEEFKLKFDKLINEYPNIYVTEDNDGYLLAYHNITYAKVWLG
jgi:hypothetical protein